MQKLREKKLQPKHSREKRQKDDETPTEPNQDTQKII